MPPAGDTALRRWAAWTAWPAGALAAVRGVCFLVLLARNGADPRVDTYDYWLASAVMGMAFPVVGALIVSHYPRNSLGWLFVGMGLFIAAEAFADEYAARSLLTAPGSLPGGEVAAWIGSFVGDAALSCLPFVALLFPDGRLPSRRWRPVAWLAAGTVILVIVIFLFRPGPLEEHPSITNPTGLPGARPALDLLGYVAGAGFMVSLLVGLAALAVRLRRSRGTERQQLKWVTYAIAVGPASLVGNTLFPDWAWLIGGVAVACVPLAMGIAVLKYRLYDIDLIINRTLVYGALTAGVVGVYVAVVGSMGALFRTGNDLVVSLVATAIVAVLFAPVRERVQRTVNRLMFGERDDPYAAVSRLGERLEATLAPEAVLPAIVPTIRETLKLPYVAIALPRDDALVVAASSGEHRDGSTDEQLVLPLSYGGEAVGQLLLAPRGPGEGFSAGDLRLLADLARHAGVAVYGVRAMADLRRSRERLVLAREEERRRLRRTSTTSLPRRSPRSG